MRTITETNLAGLPVDLQTTIDANIGKNEIVMLCMLFEDVGRVLFSNYHYSAAVVITDYKLILSVPRASSPFSFPEDESGKKIHIIGLENIKEVQISDKHDCVLVDYGKIFYFGGGGSSASPICIHFEEHEPLLNKTYQVLTESVANAFVRVRTPALAPKPAISDVADQLAKLFDLYKNKAISAVEYEAAKKKLLG